MEKDNLEMKKLGIMKLEEYEKVKAEMHRAEMKRRAVSQALEDEEKRKLQEAMSMRVQRLFRGHLGRIRFGRFKAAKIKYETEYAAATRIQATRRGLLGRKKYLLHKEIVEREERQ